MADVRLYILAGTFLAVIFAFIWFMTALRRARRLRRHEMYHNVPSDAKADDAGFDASLDGLRLEVAADAPSAALLTPLRTGEWVPSAEPVSPEQLKEVALEQRIDTFQPAPSVPEPSFNVVKYQPWEVGQPAPMPDTGAPLTAAPVAAPAVLQDTPAPAPSLDAIVPEVGVEPPTTSSPPEPDIELDAEIASLLPHGLDDDDLAEASVDELDAEPRPQPEPAPKPQPEPAPEPQPDPEPQPQPEPMPEPEPQLQPELQPEPAVTLEEAFGEMGWSRPDVSVVAHPEPMPAATESAAASQSAAPRPTAKVTAAEPPAPIEPPVTAPAPRKPRPVVTVGGTPYAPPATVEHSSDATRPDERDIPELVMSSPVEMWFGDSRVGVKAGTATYDRFRKYADVLLQDLKASRSASR